MIGERWKIGKNWRRLFAEFVVVAIGVMVALAVDNWNEDRKERILEGEYLAGIIADLDASAVSLERTRDAAEVNQGALRFLMISPGCAPCSTRCRPNDTTRSCLVSPPAFSVDNTSGFDEERIGKIVFAIQVMCCKLETCCFTHAFDLRACVFPGKFG